MASMILFSCKPVQLLFRIRKQYDDVVCDPEVYQPEIEASHKVFGIDPGNVLHLWVFYVRIIRQGLQPGSQMDAKRRMQPINLIDHPYKALILFMA